MPVSTVFTNTDNQAWAVSNGKSEFYFTSLDGEGGAREFLQRQYWWRRLVWEEATTPIWDVELGTMDREHPCSRLVGTDWRVWRHR